MELRYPLGHGDRLERQARQQDMEIIWAVGGQPELVIDEILWEHGLILVKNRDGGYRLRWRDDLRELSERPGPAWHSCNPS